MPLFSWDTLFNFIINSFLMVAATIPPYSHVNNSMNTTGHLEVDACIRALRFNLSHMTLEEIALKCQLCLLATPLSTKFPAAPTEESWQKGP